MHMCLYVHVYMPMLCMYVDIYISIQSGKLSKNKTRRKRKQKYYLKKRNLSPKNSWSQ